MTWLKALYGAAAAIVVAGVGALAARNSKTAADRDSLGADQTPDDPADTAAQLIFEHYYETGVWLTAEQVQQRLADPVDARVADCQQTLGIWPRTDRGEPLDVYPDWMGRLDRRQP